MVKRYRYFTCIKEDRFTKWEYLSEEELTTKVVKNDYTSCFQTIEWWDENGEKHCPIYADFDGPTAQRDAYDFVLALENEFYVTPQIYFSGSKGFHVVLDVDMHGENCEAMAKYIVTTLCNAESLDKGMYKKRNMWRIYNTLNEKSVLYKIQISKWDLISLMIHEIKFMAREAGSTWDSDFSEFDDIAFGRLCIEGSGSLARPEHVDKKQSEKAWELMATPCIYRLIKEAPEDGTKHNTQVILARFFKWAGTSEQEAIDVLLDNPHYREHEEHLRQVFSSVYGNGKNWNFGCKNCDLMQDKCISSCLYYRRVDELE
jgi:hypothetical protein